VTDFAGMLGTLAAARVEFVVVGGLAATMHGSTRLTRHVDVVYSRSAENIERLVDALRPVRPYLRGAPQGLPFEWSAATVRRGLNFELTTEIGDLDLLGELVGGRTYETLVARSESVPVFGYQVRRAPLIDLILVKRAAGQAKDLVVAAELEAILEERARMG
jgi:hypothetical protein